LSNVRAIRVPPTLVRGRVRRLVEMADGTEHVQVWSGCAWYAEAPETIPIVEVRRGVAPPPAILRALDVPEEDWPHPSPTQFLSLLSVWPAADAIISPVSLLLTI